MKRIRIKLENSNLFPIPLTYEEASKIGLQYVFGSLGVIYDVINEHVFMLAVIQYGLKFVEVVEKKKWTENFTKDPRQYADYIGTGK